MNTSEVNVKDLENLKNKFNESKDGFKTIINAVSSVVNNISTSGSWQGEDANSLISMCNRKNDDIVKIFEAGMDLYVKYLEEYIKNIKEINGS